MGKRSKEGTEERKKGKQAGKLENTETWNDLASNIVQFTEANSKLPHLFKRRIIKHDESGWY